jgi:hypothetical protein
MLINVKKFLIFVKNYYNYEETTDFIAAASQ